ncbi:protein PPLZ12-like [Pistacia vera]|uniref:protein PPLZ12-like n=1 Tax=Pistacia vera TaxID=55513 RepID=UPI001262C01A|nr:protein PPLZ12-like [Pistacia vera]
MGNTFCGVIGCIDQASIGVVEKWGRFDKLAQPGFNLFNPFAGEWLAGVMSTRISSLDVRIETKTKKGEVVNLFGELEKVMGAYGYSIEHILMVDIIPDAAVRKAMNEINAAQRLKLASVYKGEAEKILQVKRAEAEAEAKYLGGVGVARQRQAITDGLRENILNFSHKVEGASAKEVMDLIMVTQYFDTIKDLGNSSKNTTVFIPHGPGHVRDITEQIRNGMMEGACAEIKIE